MQDNTLTRAEIKQLAKDALRGNWGIGIIVMIIYGAITSALGIFPPLLILVAPPLIVGISLMALNGIRSNSVDLENLFDGFKSLKLAVFTSLRVFLVVFAWGLLPMGIMAVLVIGASTFMSPAVALVGIIAFIIALFPGILAQLDYAMVYFIIADNPTITAKEALQISKKIMYGYRFAYFMLMLSFIGWFILSFFTFFIGLLWLSPYVFVSTAAFYEQLQGHSNAQKDQTATLEF